VIGQVNQRITVTETDRLSRLDALKKLSLPCAESMTVSFSQRVKLADDVLVSNLEGESVLLNLKSERYYGLDQVGTRFLTLLSSSESIEHAFDALLAEYDVEAETLRTDLTALLLDLREQGLVEISD
jgi:Coenzyme PQQ synthesis protein D (PqqD).